MNVSVIVASGAAIGLARQVSDAVAASREVQGQDLRPRGRLQELKREVIVADLHTLLGEAPAVAHAPITTSIRERASTSPRVRTGPSGT